MTYHTHTKAELIAALEARDAAIAEHRKNLVEIQTSWEEQRKMWMQEISDLEDRFNASRHELSHFRELSTTYLRIIDNLAKAFQS